jgi:phosphoribosylcarboxyaminoimidazole (NCAIR) mutase
MAQPLVGIIMGSSSDWETMRHAADALRELDVPHETRSSRRIERRSDSMNMPIRQKSVGSRS